MRKPVLFCFLLIILFIHHSARAAEFSLRPLASEKLDLGVGQQFLVDLSLITKDSENINAIEGTIFYPSELLELKEIRDGNSIINFWIERPKKDNRGQIRFSGITPGGYQGKNGFIFSAVFQAVAHGDGSVEIRESSALQNDGKGTSVPVNTIPLLFIVSSEGKLLLPIIAAQKDTDPPEAFIPEIARDPNLFENKWFAVFVAQDKGSGIDYYEIQEQREQSMQKEHWIRVQSPYLLQNQGLTSFIYMRAVDKAGNERTAMLGPRSSPQYALYIVLSIILLGIVAFIIMLIVLWDSKKRHRKK